jgi:hypothetical protein
MAFCHRYHAHGQRRPGLHGRNRRAAIGRRAASEECEFRGAAADVEQDRAVCTGIEQRSAAMCSQPCFGFPVDDLQLQSGRGTHAAKKIAAVQCCSAGFRRDETRADMAMLRELAGAYLQSADGANHGRIGQATGSGKPLAQPNDTGKRVDDVKSLGGRMCDE